MKIRPEKRKKSTVLSGSIFHDNASDTLIAIGMLKTNTNTETLSAECMFCRKTFELSCEQRYIVDQNENLLFKTQTDRDSY